MAGHSLYRFMRYGATLGVATLLVSPLFNGVLLAACLGVGCALLVAFGPPAVRDARELYRLSVVYVKVASATFGERLTHGPLWFAVTGFYAGYDSLSFRETLEKHYQQSSQRVRVIDETIESTLREEAAELGIDDELSKILADGGVATAVEYLDAVNDILLDAAEVGVYDEVKEVLAQHGAHRARAVLNEHRSARK